MIPKKRAAYSRGQPNPPSSLSELSNQHHGGMGLATISKPLLSNKEVPIWYSQSYIYTGYRPVRGSTTFCFQSLAYLHNETVNIYSHLIPAAVAAAFAFMASSYFSTNFPAATRADRLIVQIYLGTSLACFAISSLYHTFLCHSLYYFDLWVKLDYITILLQILGSFISGIYVSFYCEPGLRKLHWSIVCALQLRLQVVALSNWFTDRVNIPCHSAYRAKSPAANTQMAPT
jgi:adiponectin receptor